MPSPHAVPVNRYLLLILTLAVLWIAAGCSSITGTSTPVILDPRPDACVDRVLVVVWGDLNQDGVQDPDEPPLADVLLGIAPKDDPADEGIQLTTNQDGRANFPTRELNGCSTLVLPGLNNVRDKLVFRQHFKQLGTRIGL